MDAVVNDARRNVGMIEPYAGTSDIHVMVEGRCGGRIEWQMRPRLCDEKYPQSG
jgi:hypothetical protein